MKLILTVVASLILASSLHAQTVKELQAEIVALQTLVTSFSALQKEVATLQNTVASQASEIATGQKTATTNQTIDTTSVAALQRQVTLIAANPALALGPFVKVDPNPENGLPGPHVTFSGCNLHVVNGAGQTALTNGLGNILIGYDEDPQYAGGFTDPLTQLQISTILNVPTSLQSGDRGGSHNLIIGRWHRFTANAFGGLVAGELNTITDEADSILGGVLNRTNVNSGSLSTIVGGAGNSTGSGYFSTVLGGEFCGTGGTSFSTVVGGYSNHAQYYYAVTLGGSNNNCGGEFSVILGSSDNYITTAQTITPTLSTPAQ